MGRLIEVTTVVELSLGGQKGGRLLRFNLQLFSTIITGPWLLGAYGGLHCDYSNRGSWNKIISEQTKDSQVLLQTDLLNSRFNYAIVETLKNRLNLPLGNKLNL